MGARPLKGHCQKLGAKRKREVLLGFSPPLMMQSPNSIQGAEVHLNALGTGEWGLFPWRLTSTQSPEWRVQKPTHGHKDRGPAQGTTS